MKVLSLLQPWATLVVQGFKTVEIRSWKTAYRGPLLIHASSGRSGALIAAEPPLSKHIRNFSALPFGAIIGQVSLEDIVPAEDLLHTGGSIEKRTLENKVFGNYTPGRWGWIFTDPLLFASPVPYRGSLHLWEYDGPLPL